MSAEFAFNKHNQSRVRDFVLIKESRFDLVSDNQLQKRFNNFVKKEPINYNIMASETAEEPRKDQDTKIVDVRDSDVLCGRGGAALRHAGNQTYRRLVNLNKGLYITCLKTEKLKISRSIVAAIREQNGRFLEKDANDDTWYDIGDKKAIEKTSQALRENQPKLRQKIVEMGGGVAGTAAFMESQYGHPGIYNPEQVGLTPVSLDSTTRGSSAGNAMPQHSVQSYLPQEMRTMQSLQVMHPSHQYHGDTNPDAMLSRLSISENPRGSSSFQAPYPVQSMQPVQQPFQRMGGNAMHSNSSGMMAGATSNHTDRYGRSNLSMDLAQRGSPNPHNMQQRVQRLRPGLYNRDSHSGKELGFSLQMDSNISLMSEISQFGSGEISQFASAELAGTPANEAQRAQGHLGERYSNGSAMPNESFAMDSSFKNKLAGMSLPDHSTHLDSTSTHSMDISAHNPIPLSAALDGSSATRNGGGSFHHNYAGSYMDRREILKNMKYSRPSESKNHPYSQASLNDDINMLESNHTLMSGSSNMTGFSEDKDFMSKKGNPYVPPKPLVETAKVIDHSRLGDTLRMSRHGDQLAADSRHSIMSGLSRISDTSFDQSIFSDLSRKIGNVSTRSLTPSEISAMDMHHRTDPDPSESEVPDDVDDLPTRETKTEAPVEFKL